MKVAFATLGCRVNTYESEAMTEKFVREGYEVVDFNEMADVYVVNTCSVTNMGDKKSRQIIGRARRQNPEAIIAVVGCYAQIAPTEVSGIEGVDVVLGSRNKGEIVYYVNKAKDEGKQQVKVGAVLKNKVFEDLKIEEYNNKTRAFLKIQDGCNRFCAYCLIPYTRGSVCSKDPKKVLEEIRSLADHGFKEIILSGIHTASYGVDLDEKVTLVDLLEEIEKIDGIERVRIGSIDPTFFTEDVVRRILALKKLCPHFHLSLQSGCDATLKRMNRRYTAKEYEETYEFLKRIALSKTHIFKYSPRKGTRAENMENQVDGNKKDERSKKLIELNRINEKAFAEKYIGEVIDVLFEEEVELGSGIYTGYTRNYIKVNAKADCNVSGKILNVNINSFEGEVAKGEIVL